jgi:hypothetical protein
MATRWWAKVWQKIQLFTIQTVMWLGWGLGMMRTGTRRLGRMGTSTGGAGNWRGQRKHDCVEKCIRHCVKKKEKENGSCRIESPYIHNSFFLPRDYTITMKSKL